MPLAQTLAFGMVENAVECARLTVRNSEKYSDAYETQWLSVAGLAAAYAEAGDFDKAIEEQERAIGRATPDVKGLLRERLELYQSGKPLRTRDKR